MSSKEAFETLTAEQKAALKGHLQANGFKAAVEKLKEATEGEAPEGSGAVSVEVVDAMVRRPPTLTPHPRHLAPDRKKVHTGGGYLSFDVSHTPRP